MAHYTNMSDRMDKIAPNGEINNYIGIFCGSSVTDLSKFYPAKALAIALEIDILKLF